MIAFKDIQEAARNQIANASYFSGEAVVSDKGTSRDAIDAALDSRGLVVVVTEPLSAETFSRAPGCNETYAEIIIAVQFNPIVNASAAGAQKDLAEAVQEAASAVLGYASTDESDRFELQNNALELLITETGLRTYFLYFRKLFTLSDT